MNNIEKIISDIFGNDANIVGSGYSKKITNSVITDEKCLSFSVKKKLSLDELSPDKIIPSEIEIDGVIYKTDIIETGEIKHMVCSLPASCYSCYDSNPNSAVPCATNASTARPIKGGTIFIMPGGGYGTLGFFAVHTPTQAIVAVTNAHVADIQMYYNSYLSPGSMASLPSLDNFKNRGRLAVPFSFTSGTSSGTSFGMPFHINKGAPLPYTNRIDAAAVAVLQTDNTFVLDPLPFITNAESWKQIGLSDIPGGINTPPTFASTQELDALLDFTDLEVWSSGARTGVKKGECSFKVTSSNFGFAMEEQASVIGYTNVITILRSDPTCVVIDGGDSGSALMGKVPTYNPADPNWKDGPRTWKILGLVYAGATGAYPIGIACRIDNIANVLQIEPWLGTPKPFLNVNNMDYKVFSGKALENPKTIDNKTYWQLGTISATITKP